MALTRLKEGGNTYKAELDAHERASRDEIMALQVQRLAWSLKHAYDNVAHYRKAFDAAGVRPSDFRELSDLAKFPFTVKTDLRDNYPFNMFAVPREKLVRVHASSGTTGKPIVVGYTQRDIDTWSDVMARSIRAAGGRTGMIIHNAYGYGLFTGGLGVHYGAEKLGCTVVPISGGMTERQVQLINDFRPDIITVTPSYMLAILDEFKRQKLDPRQCSLKVGIFGAEPWTNAMRGEIEDAFDMDATDIYGLSEVIGPGVAQECIETKDGLHIWEDHFYPEVIDPDTGAVLPDGEKGELVFTSLTKEAFPVIRYRTRDLTRLLPGTARARHAADGEGHGALGRHDHPARRQPVPDPDRGGSARHRLVRRAFHSGIDSGRTHGRVDHHCRGAAGELGWPGSPRPCRSDLNPYQEHDRDQFQRAGGCACDARTLARQGEAALRQAAEGLS
ncbi:phenylacetate-CoA ligase [Bradyrhizobium sp. GM6.1]